MTILNEHSKKLIKENHNLIYGFLRDYDLDIDEYYSIAAIGLCNAANSYNNQESKFSSYAYFCMRNEVLKEIRTQNYKKRLINKKVISYDNDIFNDTDHPLSETIGMEDMFLNASYQLLKTVLSEKENNV